MLFADYVRIIRRQVPSWRERVAPQDVRLVEARVELGAWYPMDAFERLGLVVLDQVVGHEVDAIRLWGRSQVQAVLLALPELATPDDPGDSVRRFEGYLSSLFDFPVVKVDAVAAQAARFQLGYGMERVAEECATWQTIGFFEELVTASGGRQVAIDVLPRQWGVDETTSVELRWAHTRGTPPPALTMPRVLLVDDEPLVGRGVGRALRHVAVVTFATSAREALAQLEQRDFDAVVSDFQMPERDGLWLLEEVARRWPHTKRVLHSGSISTAAALAPVGVVHAFIEKPATRDVLLAAVATPPPRTS